MIKVITSTSQEFIEYMFNPLLFGLPGLPLTNRIVWREPV